MKAGYSTIADLKGRSVQELSRENDPKRVTFANSITEKDVVCVIANVTTEDSFDFFDLTLYRSKSCDEISDDEHNTISVAAADRRGNMQLQNRTSTS